ncbi:dTDP-glucose 4,6-dehydratase [Nocardiopsis arvandica]|uniref:dTDP-glucose 4,6-dehydratase n=1 Tax=Nocardiopsis sinuspersici TaxID=501010 RepID=A0A7Z0BMV8_9ACTN|nr:dTDP-glucose 4,6-dehydratase [Nocardiopsis sinuspersici]NYH55680.1 dTDP-glucose 4,6-dehydratase [Nocardiopsis sinuspersici]
MRVLVTGAAGFIGSQYTRTLLAGGYTGLDTVDVTAVDTLGYAGRRDNLPDEHPRLTFVRGDVCDPALMRELVPGHDAVVHFAAESHVDRSLEAAGVFVRVNVQGTQNLLEACLSGGVERVVHVSTDEVYGSLSEGRWTEESPLLPNNPYSASKAAADLVVRAYVRTHGLDVSTTRCTNNYGPRQHVEKFVPKSITNVLTGGEITLYGDGSHVREWLHVDDHCRAIHLVLMKGTAGRVYNVGGGDGQTNLRMAETLLGLCGAERSRIRTVADRKGHDRRYSLDDARIREELGYAPRVPFAEGLADTVAWYRDHPGWWDAAGAGQHAG